MAKHTIYLVTYDRGTNSVTDKINPYHWAYFIQVELTSGENMGIAHQLRGMPGSFYYKGPEKVDLSKSGRLKEELEVGEVGSSKIQRVHDILKTVRIDKVESSGWNCQDWALEGFDLLKAEGFIYDHMEANAVKAWLKEK
ncbi:hypothetical protein VFPFJ_01553 [Purpureocillium lilacinum]|uniref:Uncharacterized protein n=1 Tax=Purpureocillium lilacinum TaxID=33203 RepID=A0A179I1K4_PURLI|nr:hypothetical protein VFPFJ_01553 [Purpureocillium lilacinum]OAQ95443.1 hypothetical protein VFPFJ_01553 [Purpureocillium lilacinum]PWI71509.1 hypothetical protein PCL_11603 [Purpureocillium lilacinum]GJN80293.1 hypothetical protein PLIIFM63780_003819 [Purpureocillium lilacinum]